jgi:AraC family transcriptional activator of pobA
MMSDTLKINSIAQVHKWIGRESPSHPLISLIAASWKPPMQMKIEIVNRKIVSALYTISLKRGDECGLKYGRQNYDFQSGSVMFLAPGQVAVPVQSEQDLEPDGEGWTLLFHPDLIRRSELVAKMKEYSFFGYESHEALHLSDKEQRTLTALVKQIEEEYSQPADVHSQEMLVSYLQLLLGHCKRFYCRQFIMRSNANQDVIAKLERYLEEYFESDKPAARGLPTVQECAKALGYSPDYLSDLLKKETGKNTREHIHYFLIEKAKTRLLASETRINEIAYSLGFEHPHHFSKLFRNKTGMSPRQYRQ